MISLGRLRDARAVACRAYAARIASRTRREIGIPARRRRAALRAFSGAKRTFGSFTTRCCKDTLSLRRRTLPAHDLSGAALARGSFVRRVWLDYRGPPPPRARRWLLEIVGFWTAEYVARKKRCIEALACPT